MKVSDVWDYKGRLVTIERIMEIEYCADCECRQITEAADDSAYGLDGEEVRYAIPKHNKLLAIETAIWWTIGPLSENTENTLVKIRWRKLGNYCTGLLRMNRGLWVST